MKILSIGGTRPQFVKMAVIVNAFNEYNENNSNAVTHRLIHTGQHFDPTMSDIFFKELGLPEPQALLGIHSGFPGRQTAAMLASIEVSLLDWKPDAVIIYGDTNSTLAAALAAVKLHIPLIHLEAGLRSFNRHMQEEINRIVSDHVSDLLLCPTRRAVTQLQTEGLGDRALFSGDVMLDAVLRFGGTNRRRPAIEGFPQSDSPYALVTMHRAENTDDAKRLGDLCQAVLELPLPVVLPMHPRLKRLLGEEGTRMLTRNPNIHIIPPVGYFEMLALEKDARFILTDSGGVQKEAYFMGVQCLTMRDETEWEETLHGGWNSLVGTHPGKIMSAVHNLLSDGPLMRRDRADLAAFGEGHAGTRSVEQIMNFLRAA
jgi:UDP-GlcNAc3NAcA epimerase